MIGKKKISSGFQAFRGHPYVQKAWAAFEDFLASVQSSLNHRLFDASVDFWSYHLGGIAILLAFDLALNSIFSSSFMMEFISVAGTTWGTGFFFAGLLLRSHYKTAKWEAQAHTMVLVKTVACSVFFAFFIVLFMSIVSMAFYFDDLYRFRRLDSPGISEIAVIAEFVFRNWFVTSFYLLCWMMAYIGITSRRKTKQVEIDNLRLQNSLKEAELTSLSNQLNPHFLFNALNNIRFMIHEDANNAERMLMSLSGVLRYSLESSKNEKVSLKEELEISRLYIDLIKIQFEERLQFTLEISDQLLSCHLPPMVLQMLLENAVKHGIDNIREGGKIEVHAELENQIMTLHVCNDLPEDYATTQSEPGIGLFNIDQRLDLLYAGRGSVDTDITDNRFCVTVTIPQD
ncbi:MAG: sensor histidine kinase YesM [Arenicella sp.]|jgi:sensor histidine kinase YesM